MPNILDPREANIPDTPRWTRRKFLGTVASLAAASAIGCRDEKNDRSDTKTDHHLSRDEKRQELEKQQMLPFHRNPEQWLTQHADLFRRGFDLSGKPVTKVEEYCVEDALPLEVREGVRMRRTPGTTILQERTASLERIRECLRGFSTDEKRIAYHGNSHGDCGAGKKFAKDNHLTGDTDILAKEEIQSRIGALRDAGIDASFGTHIAIETMRRTQGFHTAIMGIVSQDGSFHDWKIADLPPSFVASSHDPEEVAHGVDIMLKVARSDHGYGDLLEKFTILALHNRDNTILSKTILDRLKNVAKNYSQDLKIQIIPWDAPQVR